MDRKSFKAVLTFRLSNVETGEILYELIKEYDLYYLSHRNFLHDKLDDFIQRVVKNGQCCQYSIEFISKVSPQSTELSLHF